MTLSPSSTVGAEDVNTKMPSEVFGSASTLGVEEAFLQEEPV